MPVRLRFVPLFLVAALGCGLHLHRPRDAASAEGADVELKASRLVDGFVQELGQSRSMSNDEVAAAQAWAEVGRNRDLLDILGAKGEADPEVEVLFFSRCRARFKGDGWTTLCSKISTRLHALTGHAFPLGDAPAGGSGSKARPPAGGSEPAADLLRELRTLQRQWKGPDSGESQLARAVNEHQLAARALHLGAADAAGPGCPVLDAPGRSPVLQASFDRQRGLCRDRRANLGALRERIVCAGPACGPSELGVLVNSMLAVHDALQQHHDELSRRLYAYEAAKQPCSGPDPGKGRPKPIPTPAPGTTKLPPASDRPSTPAPGPGLSTEPAKPTQPEAPPPARPASTASLFVPTAMSSETGPLAPVAMAMAQGAGPSEHVRHDMPLGAGPSTPVPFDLSSFTRSDVLLDIFPGAGLIGSPTPLRLAPPPTAAPATTPGSAPVATAPTTTAVTPTPGTRASAGGTTTAATPAPGTRVPAGNSTSFSPGAGGSVVFTPTDVCDDAVLQARFAALSTVPIPAVLVSEDLRPLAELGRLWQLAEQLAAVDALIESLQLRARRKAAADADPKAAQALAGAPRFAKVVHTTIVGIDRLQQTVDTLELAILALIRETLRVEHDALDEGIGYAERRLRLSRAKLGAALDEAVLLMEASASVAKLERVGCTSQALMSAYEGGKCRDELTKSLVAFGNAWTLGRANEKRADALDLGARHDASIARSRAAMALRQVYLTAGVTELVKFTKGGMAPEALAQLIVSTVGFGVLAGAVLAP